MIVALRRLAAAVVLAALASAGVLLVASAADAATPTVVISAHRGGAGQWPQNSLLAFKDALAAGVDEIEADAYLSADGYRVIYHDPTISAARCGRRFAGRFIWTLTMREIASIRCEGQPIARESQVLRLLAASPNRSAVLRLETKSFPGQSAASARAWAHRIAAPVVAAKLTGRAIMQDFDWDGLAGYRTASPDLRVSALIARPTPADVDRAAALGAYDLSYDAPSETSELDAYIASKGLVPTVWATDAVPTLSGRPSRSISDAAVAAFTTAVCDGARVVITNYPTVLLAARPTLTCP